MGRSARIPLCAFVVSLAAWTAPAGGSEPAPESVLEPARRGREAQAARQYAEAAARYREGLEAAVDPLMTAILHGLVAELCEERQLFQEALASYESGLATLAKAASPGIDQAVGQALDRLSRSGKSAVAAAGLPLSLELFRGELPDPKDLSAGLASRRDLGTLLLIRAANLYLLQKQVPQAEGLYRQALEQAREGGMARAERGALLNLAWSALVRRDLQAADRRLEEALGAEERRGPSLEDRGAHLALAVKLREEGRYSEAAAHLEKVVALYVQARDEPGRARALAHLGTAEALAGRCADAATRYDEALRLETQVGDPETRWHAHGGLARCLLSLGLYRQALPHFEAYLDAVQALGEGFGTDQGRLSFLENHAEIFDGYVRSALSVATHDGPAEVAHPAIERVRDRALTALQVGRSLSPSSRAGHLNAFYVSSFGAAHAGAWQERSAGTALDVRQQAPGTSLRPPTGSAESPVEEPAGEPVREPDAVFLGYYVLAGQTAILVRDGDRVFTAVAGKGEAVVQPLVEDYVGSLGLEGGRGVSLADGVPTQGASDAGRSSSEVARELRRILIDPVRAHLPFGSTRTLVIIPHRALWRLPFAALEDEDGSFFGDRCLLTYAASEESWRLTARRARPADHRDVRAWVVGNPRFPPSVYACGSRFELRPLPGAEAEARAVERTLGAARSEVFLGPQADRLRLEAWHSEPTVLHLATHGVACADDPLGSFLALSPLERVRARLDGATGQLTLAHDPRRPVILDGFREAGWSSGGDVERDVAFAPLLEARSIIEWFRLRADLVTLSACQTGLGQTLGQGTIGFTRAFLAAGARSVLVSLWNVDDRATSELIAVFYREYARHGNKALALQRAMVEARRRHPQPRLWAPFTLVGMAE